MFCILERPSNQYDIPRVVGYIDGAFKKCKGVNSKCAKSINWKILRRLEFYSFEGVFHEHFVELLLRENSVEWEGTMFVLCMEMVW